MYPYYKFNPPKSVQIFTGDNVNNINEEITDIYVNGLKFTYYEGFFAENFDSYFNIIDLSDNTNVDLSGNTDGEIGYSISPNSSYFNRGTSRNANGIFKWFDTASIGTSDSNSRTNLFAAKLSSYGYGITYKVLLFDAQYPVKSLSYVFEGYFRPNKTGYWALYFYCGSFMYCWVGEKSSYTRQTANAKREVDGTSYYYPDYYVPYFTNEGQPLSGDYMNAFEYYPLKIIYGDRSNLS